MSSKNCVPPDITEENCQCTATEPTNKSIQDINQGKTLLRSFIIPIIVVMAAVGLGLFMLRGTVPEEQFTHMPDESEDSEFIALSQSESDICEYTNAAEDEPGPGYWSLVIKPAFDYVTPFRSGVAAVRVSNNGAEKWGLINTSGDFLLEPIYNDMGNLSQFYFIDDTPLEFFPVQLDNLWGVLDRYGNEIIPFIYEEIYIFSNGLARVQLGAYALGLINPATGEEIAPPIYSEINPPIGGLMQVTQEHLRWLDRTGGDLWAGGNIGFMDETGNYAIPAIYYRTRGFRHGMAIVSYNPYWASHTWGVVDSTGREILPMIYTEIQIISEYAIAARTGDILGPVGIFNKNGEEIFPYVFDMVLSMWERDSLALVYTGLWLGGIDNIDIMNILGSYGGVGLVDTRTGEIVIPPGIYSNIRYIGNGLALVRAGERGVDETSGIVDLTTGEEIVPLGIYNHIFMSMVSRLATMSRGQDENRGTGVIYTPTGEIIVEPIWGRVNILCNEMIAISPPWDWDADFLVFEEKWGIVDRTGVEITPPEFNAVRSFTPGLAAAGIGERQFSEDPLESLRFIGQWGLISSTGEMLIPMEYDFIGDFISDFHFSEWSRDGLTTVNIGGEWAPGRGNDFFNACIFVGGRWGLVDTEGTLVVRPEMEFDEIGHITENMVAVKQNGLWGFVRIFP